jgi:hypothetical protein
LIDVEKKVLLGSEVLDEAGKMVVFFCRFGLVLVLFGAFLLGGA